MTPVYVHGHPGHHKEIALAGLDPTVFDQTLKPDSHIIAFSLGAHRALTYAAQNGAAKIDLIAPAAPLSLGNFLDDMAGAPVFRAALKGRLHALTSAQSLLARLAPSLLARMILAGAPAPDRAVFATPDGKHALKPILRHSLMTNRSDYEAAIKAYVTDWSDALPKVTCPVTIWHGDADTWAPLAMGQALTHALPHATLKTCAGLGHYSTLVDALPKIANGQS